MKCYQIVQDEESEFACRYSWCRTNDFSSTFKLPFPIDEWVPDRDIEFELEDAASPEVGSRLWHLTKRSAHEIQELWCVTSPKTKDALDVLNYFTISLTALPIISAKLRNSIEPLDAHMFEFIEIKNIWHEAAGRPLAGGPYYLANLLTRQDAWDKSAMQFSSISRADGSIFKAVKHNKRVVRELKAGIFPIWRDTYTNDVVCNEMFREAVVASGCQGWRFRDIETSKS